MGPVAVTARTAALAAVRALVSEFASGIGAPIEVADDLVLAVDEVCSNIVRHGYPPPAPPDAAFTVELEARETGIAVVVRDQGLAFDVQNAAVPELSEWINRGKKGGLGLKLIHMLVDDVRYQRIDGTNEVTLSKRLANP